MWLDRISGAAHGATASTPQPSRSFSPLPRRTSSNLSPYVTSQRAAASTPPRGSTLSLVSNDSTASLLSASKKQNSSNLKQSTSVDDGPEPLEVLEKLLGTKASATPAGNQAGARITEEDLLGEFDFGGKSLRELALSDDVDVIAAEPYRHQSVEEYQREKTRLEDLHRSIRACDDVLNSVETNLASFRNDLAAVSADIETLQARSTSLTVRLENRKAVEKGLGPIVEELSVSPLVVSKIAEGPIDDAWIKALAEVDKRSASFRKDAASSRPSKAMADLGPLLEKLVQKAVERIRDFLVAQIKALRSPNINAQIIQQQNFLKYQDLFTFLHKHHAVLAEEICLAYMNTMRWYYITQFTRYSKALEKIKLHVLDKSDVLGHDDGPSSRSRSTARTSGPPHDAFSLGRRMDLLRTGNQSALPSHVAEDDSATHYLEVPFRNFNLALVDNATAEYTFLTRFFSPAQSHAIISRNFTYIFEPTFTLGQSLTRQLITDTYDTLGLLLAIRINQQFAFELQRRRVPVLDGYVNATNMLLWPRLQLVMGHHSESVRALSSKPSGSSSAAAASSAAPHVVTQRFGQLLHGILTLSTGSAGNPGDMSGHTGTGNDDEPVFASVGRLRADVEAFLTRLAAATFPSDRRRRDRFLYNNYSLVLTIISDVPGRLAAEQREHFEGLKKNLQE